MLITTRLSLLTIATLTVLLAGCGGGAPAPQAPPPTPVTVVTVVPEPVALTRELPGRVHPLLVAEVRPQVSGIVKKVLFTEGGRVEAGQPLYQLDDATYLADVNSSKAQLARAQATLNSAQLTAARADELVKIEAVSAQDHENAVAALRQAEAEVGMMRAALDRAKVTASYARIVSPIAGRIGKSTVTQGALVTANQEAALATVQQLDPIYVDVTQSSTEWLELRRALDSGNLSDGSDVPVSILLEDGSRYEHDGKLVFSEVTVDTNTGSYALRIVVDNPANLLLPGMYVRAAVSKGERANGLLVPQPAITRDPTGKAIAMVVGADGKVEQRTVQVSQTVGNRWLVESGLAAGDKVIVEGLQKIRPGAAVKPTERGAEALAAPPPPAPAPAAR
ncbi:MAG: efflux RND transporter periplasmic adaptor subunit [Aquimonas sp.]|jgi:membrane fusion protein (multidrug efflux system)|nr:efflux RND transporter periplasmic adaptor subunit [Aquimonas sp.]